MYTKQLLKYARKCGIKHVIPTELKNLEVPVISFYKHVVPTELRTH